MARLPRIVIPGIPHHVTQRGNRRQTTFFEIEDFHIYKRCLQHACVMYGVEIWAYCLMPNHVHLIAIPEKEESLSKAMGRGHEAYSRYINFKHKWRGLFWQARYQSFPMDEAHTYNAARYIELNPVRAGMVKTAQEYSWSSARAHLDLQEDSFFNSQALSKQIEDWQAYLSEGLLQEEVDQLRRHQKSGRPLGARSFVDNLEKLTGRILHLQLPGPKKKV